ncbi:MAG TPA: hypothetical protein VMR28_02090 [Candidatus Saccharimonadales bacterium]|nr:hypothetical protein [Candidatus Saccharimonadales bacterium]
MLNESQRENIARRLTGELPDISDAQRQHVGDFVFTLAALPVGHDIDFLLDALDPDEGKKEPVLSAARICLDEMTSNLA